MTNDSSKYSISNNSGKIGAIGDNSQGTINNYRQDSSRQSTYQKNNQTLLLNKLIGQGGYGKVYQGTWQGQIVAIKKMSSSNAKEIRQEIKALKKLKSNYVIDYYDQYQKDHDIYLIMEYAEQGSLANFINQHKDQEHDWPLNYNFISQITKGLSYLHNNKVIHRDLKSHNVLITKNNIAKLADFGLAKLLDGSYSSSGEKLKGTIHWMAPELIIHNQPHTFYSDIYSLGMVMWEIVNKSTRPFANLDDERLIITTYLRGERESIPTGTPRELIEVIGNCWREKPTERISLTDIENKLNELGQTIEIIEIEDNDDLDIIEARSNKLEQRNDEGKTKVTSTQSSSNLVMKKQILQLQSQLQLTHKEKELKELTSSLKEKLKDELRSNPFIYGDRKKKLISIFNYLPITLEEFTNKLESLKKGLSKNLDQEIKQLYQIKQEIVELSSDSCQSQIEIYPK